MTREQELDDVERRIIRSYVWLLRAPVTVDGRKIVLLHRQGIYDVRLLEPSEMPQGDTLPFWLELRDTKRGISLDSYGTDDVEDAAVVARTLMSRAQLLAQNQADN
jgi:hypothetical protein